MYLANITLKIPREIELGGSRFFMSATLASKKTHNFFPNGSFLSAAQKLIILTLLIESNCIYVDLIDNFVFSSHEHIIIFRANMNQMCVAPPPHRLIRIEKRTCTF